MKRVGLALGPALALTLLLGPARAWGDHTFVAVRSSHASVFISPGHPFVHRHFVHHRFIHHHFGPPVLVTNPVIVVNPVPRRVWVPGFWWWDGFQRIWVPGHWVFAGPRLLLRNPCD